MVTGIEKGQNAGKTHNVESQPLSFADIQQEIAHL
jgi:hypothetical protein